MRNTESIDKWGEDGENNGETDEIEGYCQKNSTFWIGWLEFIHAEIVSKSWELQFYLLQ